MIATYTLLILARLMMASADGSRCVAGISKYCTDANNYWDCSTRAPVACSSTGNGNECHPDPSQTTVFCGNQCADANLNSGRVCQDPSSSTLYFSCDANYHNWAALNCAQGQCYRRTDGSATCVRPICYDNNSGFERLFTDGNIIIECDNGAEVSPRYNCPTGLDFDATTRDCRPAAHSDYPSCTEPGQFALDSDCRKYSECIRTSDGFEQRYHECPQGQMFSETSQACSDPCTWNNPVFVCRAQGRFADPMDCGQYITCSSNGSGGFRKSVSSCPPGYHFNPTSVRCESTSTYSSCRPQQPTKCSFAACG